MLELWGMWTTPLLPILPGSLWSRGVAPDRVLSMGQIEQTVCKQITDVKLWLVINQYVKTFNCAQKRAQVHLRMLSTKYIHKSYIWDICRNRIRH